LYEILISNQDTIIGRNSTTLASFLRK